MKILVVQLGKIGDLVCTTPLLRTLERGLRSRVDLVALDFASDLLQGNDAVGKIYSRTVDPKTLDLGNYSHALILMPNVEIWRTCRRAGILNLWGTTHKYMTWREKFFSWFLTRKFKYDYQGSIEEHYLEFAKALGIRELFLEREIHRSDADKNKAQSFLATNSLSDKKLVGISMTGGKTFKEWGLENYVRLVDELSGRNFFVIGAGSLVDRGKLEELSSKIENPKMFFNVAGQFSLCEFAALASKFICFIAADTGPLYIADALGVPVIDLMGPCWAPGQHPKGKKAIIVGECKNPEHAKCLMMHCPSSKSTEFNRCMQEISFEEVWEAFQKIVT